MNTPESLVLNLQWSKKLVEAGIVLDTLFYWILDISGKWSTTNLDLKGKDKKWLENRGKINIKNMGSTIAAGMIRENLRKEGYKLEDLTKAYPAPLLEEVLELLPREITKEKKNIGYALSQLI